MFSIDQVGRIWKGTLVKRTCASKKALRGCHLTGCLSHALHSNAISRSLCRMFEFELIGRGTSTEQFVKGCVWWKRLVGGIESGPIHTIHTEHMMRLVIL